MPAHCNGFGIGRVVTEKTYALIGPDGRSYQSKTKGAFGGHRRLYIYGRLDCPSALRHIVRGEYIKYRVFFEDEPTARAAGYRPCARCMPKEYAIWKAAQSKTSI